MNIGKKILGGALALTFGLLLCSCGSSSSSGGAKYPPSMDGLDSLSADTNFQIKIESSISTSEGKDILSYGSVNGLTWVAENSNVGTSYSSSSGFAISSDAYYMYSDDKFVLVSQKTGDPTMDAPFEQAKGTYATTVRSIASSFLSLGSSATSFKKKGSDTVAGRKCTKYTCDYEGQNATIWIDNEYACTLKYDFSATVGGVKMYEANGEVVEFNIGSSAKAPSLS